MLLSRLIASADGAKLEGKDCEITGITADSREVKPGYLFAAIPGETQDGQNYIADAIAKGAVAVLRTVESPSPLGGKGWDGGSANSDNPPSAKTKGLLKQTQVFASSPQGGKAPAIISTPNIRKTLSDIASKFYPKQPDIIAAVTGTSGKTSTVQFVREVWQALGHKAASIGSLGFILPDEKRYSSINTPDPVALHQELQEAAERKISHLAMEASSHGLAMHRMDGVRLKAAAFTNLSRDHLDYHETMESYFTAKQRLFNELLPEGAVAVLNADVPEFDALSTISKKRKHKIISYGTKGKEIKLLALDPDAKGQKLSVELFGKKREVLLPVIGKFQAWNALCALGLAVACGDDAERAAQALGKVSGVAGRLELAGHTKNGASVFVDYAHKPDALENVLTALRAHADSHKGAKLGVIFGCGGNRDKGKRPMMGAIARKLADWVIVTDDNPRNEDANLIRKEILNGAATGENLQEIGDRAKAIAVGIEKLKSGDVLIIAGKGHETGQIVGDKTLPFDDVEVARQALKS